ncbi:MAG TPA: GTPase Era [Spirochaetota bacterium]|nr:GTPase Era [Spirochaetota bacterium]HOM38253.1 GTPase Era [Spirochaetota bacterium]HPQ48529.1 GTPase Era [Spirochaetota bacterium]
MKSGFVSIIGKPNAGKSSLINRLLNDNLTIVSPIPQTTRNIINCILTDKEKGFQIIFKDTPGIIKNTKHFLDEKLIKYIEDALKDIDIIVLLITPEESLFEYSNILNNLHKDKVVVAVNKSDIKMKEFSEEEKSLGFYTIHISALTGFNTDKLLEKIVSLLPDNIQYYPEDIVSDRTIRFFVSEYIREAIIKNLKEEIPHQVFIDVEEMEEREDMTIIKAIIYSEKDSQKKIIIGKSGAMIKKIGIEARKRIEDFINKKVYLELFVKVKEDWRKDKVFLNKLDYY